MLAIHTEAGKRALTRQQSVEDFIASQGFQIAETPKDSPCRVDCLILKEGVIISGAEIRCRNVPSRTLEKYGSILLTFEKIEWMQKLSFLLGVPCYFFVSTIDRILYAVKVIDSKGEVCAEHTKEKTKTQATCNGGEAVRLNAYIPVSQFTRYDMKKV